MTMHLSVGFSSRPFKCIPPSGDGWLRITLEDVDRFMLADGIGHGSRACAIVDLLVQHLKWICRRTIRITNLADCMLSMHEVLQAEGSHCQAAVALADFDRKRAVLNLVSIGNVEAHFQTPETAMSFPCIRGMVGGTFPRSIHESHMQVQAGGLLCLMSDGVGAHQARGYLHTLRHHCLDTRLSMQSAADGIVNSYGAVTDDASCLLIQATPRETP